ncbi:MAG: hypothetical protein NVSMB56_16590 [Pyrinomonadaceae bacterium]
MTAMLDYSIELINDQTRLSRLLNRLASTPVIALDIETINWWNRHQERVALIQLAFRLDRQPKVAIIDALAKLDIESLRPPLELNATVKVIHNAAFDATRLATHFQFNVAPIHDTMLAARRGGERRCSLQAQAETHLGLHLDKSTQRSDWSRRPLDAKQIHYAALDAFSTLLLYEDQTTRKLNGSFQSKQMTFSPQETLPLGDAPSDSPTGTSQSVKPFAAGQVSSSEANLNASSLALLGIITELPTRYSPDQLAVSIGSERIGLAGWIVDRLLGTDVDLDETVVKLEVAELCARDLVRITATRRLEATAEGARLWRQSKAI